MLRRITLDIKQGEFVTIMGPSGAGKSRLLAVLGMLDGAWTGEYRLHEHAVHKLDAKRRVALHKQYVGFVFQQYHLLDDLTVAENLDIPLSYRDIKKTERQASSPTRSIGSASSPRRISIPRQLSGGQQQLVAVARAVIHKPSLLLADEPTGNLHSAQGREIMELFTAAQQGRHHDHPGHAFRGRTRRTATGSSASRTGGWTRRHEHGSAPSDPDSRCA